jgi:hypothetical protein
MSDAAFQAIVEVLCDEQEAAWSTERKIPKKSEDTRTALYKYGINWLINSEKLPKLEDRRLDFSKGRHFMLLPPLEKHSQMVPLLAVYYERQEMGGDFEGACCRILVLLLQEEENQLVGMGFRIESPEALCQQDEGSFGAHDFYHAQLVREAGYGPDFSSPEWLPDKQPSFPLWAVNPVDALLNLVLTLYGAKWYLDFYRRNSTKIEGVSDEFKVLNERLNARS